MATNSVVYCVPQLEVTSQIRSFLEKAVDCDCMETDLKERCQDAIQNKCKTVTITSHTLRDVYHSMRKAGHKVFLHEIVSDSSILLPSPEPPKRNPELEARISKLKILQENKEYRRMTRNVSYSKGREALTFKEEVKSINRQMVGIFNFIVTVLAGFAFGYKGTEYMVGAVFPLQMMSGLIVGTIVFFVDLYFILRYGV